MYVRKFEADSLDDALKEIKKELGPDAIILKTITNKGLKGAFKKKKIEITAAISEKNYTKKSKVDHILNDEQKDEFYSGRSSYISNMIDQQAGPQKNLSNSGYGNLGVNKAVSSTTGGSSLDDFLNKSKSVNSQNNTPKERNDIDNKNNLDSFLQKKIPVQDQISTSPIKEEIKVQEIAPQQNYNNQEVLDGVSNNKIEILEQKVFQLTKMLGEVSQQDPDGIYHLRSTLKSLDIGDEYLQALVKKTLFELTDEQINDVDAVFEFALKEMMGDIKTDLALFSSVDTDKTPVITVLVSENASGQSSMALKLAALNKNSIIITNDKKNSSSIKVPSELNRENSFSEVFFDINLIKVDTISEIITQTRKATADGKSVFIDYKNIQNDINEVKRFVDGMKRSFDKVEVLVSLSAIHSELYNIKVASQYRKVSDGMVLSHLDLCLNFGSIFNIAQRVKDMPFKFFGTGEIVPDDLEAASAERILGGIFQLT